MISRVGSIATGIDHRLLERVSDIDDLDSRAPLRPDFKALMGAAGTPETIFETRSSLFLSSLSLHCTTSVLPARCLDGRLSMRRPFLSDPCGPARYRCNP
jgi:hypothetical protein